MAFTEPSLVASSLGSWADKCERADTALAAAEAQSGRRGPEESLEDDTATTGDLLEEEDWEWLTALGAAIAPPPPRPGGTVGRQPGPQGTPKPVQGPPLAKGDQRNRGSAPGKGAVAPKTGEAATQGAPAGGEASPPQQPAGPGRGLDPSGEGAEGRVDPASEGEGEAI